MDGDHWQGIGNGTNLKPGLDQAGSKRNEVVEVSGPSFQVEDLDGHLNVVALHRASVRDARVEEDAEVAVDVKSIDRCSQGEEVRGWERSHWTLCVAGHTHAQVVA